MNLMLGFTLLTDTHTHLKNSLRKISLPALLMFGNIPPLLSGEKKSNATRVPSEARCTLNRQHDTPRSAARTELRPLSESCVVCVEV